MFEKLRQTLRDSLHGAAHPEERRAVMAEMKATLVKARLGVDDLRTGAERTRARLGAERRELATVQRRRGLAEAIKDSETVAVAQRYERQHAERVQVLERKLEAEERDLSLAEAEVGEMLAEFKDAAAGVAPGQPAGARGPSAGEPVDASPPPDVIEELERDPLRDSLEAMGRERTRAARDAVADAQLAALKRRMGR